MQVQDTKMVIPKKIPLDGLGEEYKGSYLKFESIPFNSYDTIAKKGDELQNKDVKEKTFGSLAFIGEQLTSRFIDGEIVIDGEKTKVTKADLLELPGDTLIECFNALMGKISPN